MTTSLEIFGLNVHLYGLILGIAIVVGIWLGEKKALDYQISSQSWWQLASSAMIGGVIGARLYHVATAWSLYKNNLLEILYLYNGGLSIIGAVLGGLLAVWLFIFLSQQSLIKFSLDKKKLTFKQVLDLSVFGLPFAQAIGRWGNFVNQELYGLPTNLPWGIYIEPTKRLVGFEGWSYFHPLFLYESLLMFVFGLLVWRLEIKIRQRQKLPAIFGWFSGLKVGSGNWFIFYIFYYSIIRFLLDFIRIDKAQFLSTPLGINQLFLLTVAMVIALVVVVKIVLKKTFNNK
jgi:phosphatidylglycerol:prolipoprotein diacylglycerol transferase